MFAFILEQPALWGLGGAFIFAGQNLTVCLFESRIEGGKSTRCWFEFVVALVVGTIAAAAVWPSVKAIWSLDAEHMRGISTMVGLLANTVAPKIVKFAPDAIEQRMSRILKGEPK